MIIIGELCVSFDFSPLFTLLNFFYIFFSVCTNTESLGPTPMGAKMATRQWADADDSDDENEMKKARSLRSGGISQNNVPETVSTSNTGVSSGESSILDGIRMRASHIDNTVSDGRYGRDQDESLSRGGGGGGSGDRGFRADDNNIPRAQSQGQYQGRDDQFGVC